MTGVWRRLLFGAGVLLSLASVVRVPSLAQPTAAVVARVAAISPWTAPDRPLSIALRITNPGEAPVDGLHVRLSIFPRVLSRSQLRASLDGGAGGQPVAVTTEDVPGELAPGETRAVSVARDLGPLATPFRADSSSSGVYPLRIEITGPTGTAVTLRTAVIFFSSPPTQRLNLVWVVPAHRPPAFARGLSYAAGLVAETLDPDRLSRTLAEIAKRPAAITLVPTAVLAETLADLSGGFRLREGQRIRAVPADGREARTAGAILALLRRAATAPGLEVASAPYARGDLVALAHAGLAREARRQIVAGSARVGALLGRAPTTDLLVPAAFRADARTAGILAARGIHRLVLDSRTLPAQPGGPFEAPLFGPSRPVTVQGPGGVTFDALLVDDEVRARLAAGYAGVDRVLLAQNVLAETASAWHELPALASERLLVMASDDVPPPATTAALLAGIGAAPWLRLRTASDALAALPPQGEPIALPLASPAASPILDATVEARRAVETVERVVTGITPLERLLDRYVLASESQDWDAAPVRGLALARAARAEAAAVLGRIRAPNRQVTLTARAGDVPVTVVNQTGFPVTVRVRLESAKVVFPKGSLRVADVPGRVRTLTFPVKARAAGSFPVDVLLETPDGHREIGRGRVVVRSTAVSAVTLAATGGGALFLLAAWARRLRRARHTA